MPSSQNAPIALDATYSAGKNLTGVGVYEREILRGLCDAHPDQKFLACFRSQRFLRAWQRPLPRNCARRLLAESWVPRGARLFHGLNQRMPLGFRFARACVTFHDLFVMTGQYSSVEFRERFARQAREAAERADLIICVSHFTGQQVSSLLNIPSSRLRVVPHGVVVPGEQPALSEREPTILHVGAIQRRKNLVRLVGAFEKSLPAPWRLVLAGSRGFGAEEVTQRIAASPARDRIETPGFASDSRVADLYRSASLFVFPSLDEGFGMPVLEAMAHGLPVVASRRSAVAEVCGDAARLVDPEQEDEIAGAMRSLTSDTVAWTALRERGLQRAREFSWDLAAARTWRVYQELLES